MAITVPVDGAVISASTFGAPVANQLNAMETSRIDFQARKTVAQAIAAATAATVTYDTVDFNNLTDSGTWNGNTFTVTRAGTFLVNGYGALNGAVAGRSFFAISMGGASYRTELPAGSDTVAVTAMLRLSVGQTIFFQAYSLDGSKSVIASAIVIVRLGNG